VIVFNPDMKYIFGIVVFMTGCYFPVLSSIRLILTILQLANLMHLLLLIIGKQSLYRISNDPMSSNIVPRE